MGGMAAIDDQPPTPGHQRLADQLGRIQHITSALAGETLGVIALTCIESRAFAHTDEAFLVTVAQQCAVALDRCRLALTERSRLATAQEEARVLAALQRAGAALAGELELERLIQTVTDAATDLSGAEFGAFFYRPG